MQSNLITTVNGHTVNGNHCKWFGRQANKPKKLKGTRNKEVDETKGKIRLQKLKFSIAENFCFNFYLRNCSLTHFMLLVSFDTP